MFLENNAKNKQQLLSVQRTDTAHPSTVFTAAAVKLTLKQPVGVRSAGEKRIF